MSKYRLFLFFLILFSCAVFGQDSIYFRRNIPPASCKIIHIMKNVVTYQPQTDTSAGAVLTIPIFYIHYVVLNGGARIEFKEQTSPDSLNKNTIYAKRSAFKMELPLIIPCKISLSYERYLGRRNSIELTAGWVSNYLSLIRNGLCGADNGYNFNGQYFAIGSKLIASSVSKNGVASAGHVMQGYYLKPEFNLSFIRSFDYGVWEVQDWSGFFPRSGAQVERYKTTNIAFLLNQGYQVVTRNNAVFDFYLGFGVAFKNHKLLSVSTYPDESWALTTVTYFNHAKQELQSYLSEKFVKVSPAVQVGIRIGFLTGSVKKIKKKQ